ncbi:DUF2474 family protein [Luteibacter sp. UNCMF331Sha3.1]|nr:DUF2474 family protein [Luteibacter sp. UNCMF331Sha3.1]
MAARPGMRKTLWFVCLYIAGVAAVTVVAGLFRLLIPR